MMEKFEWINKKLSPKDKTVEDVPQHGRRLCRAKA